MKKQICLLTIIILLTLASACGGGGGENSSANTVIVTWDYDLSANPGVTGFKLYFVDGSSYIEVCDSKNILNNLSKLSMPCSIKNITPITNPLPSSISFVMTAYDDQNNESAYSNVYPVSL